MVPYRMIGNGVLRRLSAACLLIWMAAFAAAPAAVARFSDGHEKGCCRMKGHCCCKTVLKQAQPGDLSLAAASGCQRRCSLTAGFAFHTPLPAANRNAGWLPIASNSGLHLRHQAPCVSSSYFAFRYQRPPPVS